MLIAGSIQVRQLLWKHNIEACHVTRKNNSSPVKTGKLPDYKISEIHSKTAIFKGNTQKESSRISFFFIQHHKEFGIKKSKCDVCLPNINKDEAIRTRTYLMICLIWGKMEVSRDTL